MTEARTLHFADRAIGLGHPPFIIAEMSGNHNQSLQRALDMVEAAARAGVDAVKLQTLNPDSITLDVHDGDFIIRDPHSPWSGRNLHDLYQQACTPWDWHERIMQKAQSLGLICFSTPFDEQAVDFLEALDAPAYKIASFENNHLPLIKKAASTGKPLLISSGMATRDELDEAVKSARDAGCKDLIVLKCTSQYPASASDANLRSIPTLRQRYHCEIGLSDHSMGLAVPLVAVAEGATVIEKHFTLARADGGVDAEFSLQPDELEMLVRESRRAHLALGSGNIGPSDAENSARVFRRSLYIAQDMCAGDIFNAENLRIVRPGMGLAPRYYADILGMRITRDATRGTALNWELVEGNDRHDA